MVRSTVAAMGLALTTWQAAWGLEVTDARAAQITGIVELPIEGIRAVEAKGQIQFVSENGRFVISGQIYDLWYKKPLSTMAEMEDVATRLRLNDMGLKADKLGALSFGTGPKEVVVFTDPLCSLCHQLLDEAKDLGEQYTFQLIVVPALGDESSVLSGKLACTPDRAKALDALIHNRIADLPTPTACNREKYDLSLLTADLLKIRSVPFVVSHDGRISRGKPKSLKDWLEQV